MWRHEAYKISVQKRALEIESVAELQRILSRGNKQRQDIVHIVSRTMASESSKFVEKLDVAFRKMSLRIDTLEDVLTRSKLSGALDTRSDIVARFNPKVPPEPG
jgi:hypothetical protein